MRIHGLLFYVLSLVVAHVSFAGNGNGEELVPFRRVFSIEDPVVRSAVLGELRDQSNLSREDFAQRILDFQNGLRNESSDWARQTRVFAIDSLVEFGDGSVLTDLEKIFSEDNGACGCAAIAAYIELSKASDSSHKTIEALFAVDKDWARPLMDRVVAIENSILRFEDPDPQTRDTITSFLYRYFSQDPVNAVFVDRILCREIKGYRLSRQRRQSTVNCLSLAGTSDLMQRHFKRAKEEFAEIPIEALVVLPNLPAPTMEATGNPSVRGGQP